MCALGLKDNLVGRSRDCDFPPFVEELPICTDFAFIESLHPDVILVESVESLGARPAGDVKIVTYKPQSLRDFWEGISRIAEALQVAEEGKNKIALYKNKMTAIQNKGGELNPGPKVAALGWIDPLMGSGHWVPELINLAHGTDLFGKPGRPSQPLNYDDLINSDPDIIVVFPSGFNIEETRDQLELFSTKKGWFDLKAVQHNKVFLIDGNHYLNRPSPRLVDSVEMLAEIFHPDDFDFGHKNSGWQYWGFNRF